MTRLAGFDGDRMRWLNGASRESSPVRPWSWHLGVANIALALTPLALTGLMLSGCQKQSPTLTPAHAPRNTPRFQLEWVVKRLERAFDLGRPSRASGIRVAHSMSYQFKEPSESTNGYQATVVIRTRTENTFLPRHDPGGEAGQVSEGVPKIEVLRSIGVQDQATSFPGANRPDLVEGDAISGNSQGILSGTGRVPASIQEQQSFELVYQDDRWQLAQELETDLERLWFQYALQQ